MFSAGVSVAAMLAAVPANAQSPSGLPTVKPLPDFSARLGAYFPMNSRLKQNVGNTAFAGGVDYVLSRTGASDESTVSVDYIDRTSGGNQLRMVPVTFGGLHYMDVKAEQRTYVGYGVGAYFVNVSIPNSVGFQETNHTTLYGGYINAGIEFPENVFLDARYHFTQAVGSTNPSGLEVTAGVRF
jgi:hypothetical protein